MGGGEKHVGAIAEVLASQGKLDFLTHQPSDLAELERRLNLRLPGVQVRVVPDAPGFSEVIRASADYDLFINASHLDYFAPLGRRNALVVYFPATSVDQAQAISTYNRLKRVVRLSVMRIAGDRGRRVLRRAFFGSDGRSSDQTLFGRLALGAVQALASRRHQGGIFDRYQVIFANSEFTRRWIRRYWGKDSFVLYPAVDVERLAPGEKRNWILSVGRFFAGSHNKKHLEMIRAFRIARRGALGDWEYHLAGGFSSTESNEAYLEAVRRAAAEDPSVHLHVNCSLAELAALYAQSKLFWHAAGYGEDEELYPVRFEHFGITTVEAMAAGCVPVVLGKGGLPEIVEPGVNGILWTTLDELVAASLGLATDEARRQALARAAIVRAQDFGARAFRERLSRALELLGGERVGDPTR
jgi:glycosyltransferase involved in cell wall biosynthesis